MTAPARGHGTDVGAARDAAGGTTAKNTIVANPVGGPNCATNPPRSLGDNIEYDAATAPSCGFTRPSDVVGRNPLLGPLARNGGPTATHALLAASPAVDAGANAACSPTDQRGVTRADGDGNGSVVCDIGAFEFAPPRADLDLDVSAPGSARDGQRFSYTATVRNAGPARAAATALTLRLSAGQRFVAASPGCSYAAATRTVRCPLGTIPAERSAVSA